VVGDVRDVRAAAEVEVGIALLDELGRRHVLLVQDFEDADPDRVPNRLGDRGMLLWAAHLDTSCGESVRPAPADSYRLALELIIIPVERI
jgi:hypothetical protein